MITVSRCAVKLQYVLSGLERQAKTLGIHMHFCGLYLRSSLSFYSLSTCGVISQSKLIFKVPTTTWWVPPGHILIIGCQCQQEAGEIPIFTDSEQMKTPKTDCKFNKTKKSVSLDTRFVDLENTGLHPTLRSNWWLSFTTATDHHGCYCMGSVMMEGKALGVPVQHYLHPGNNVTCS